MQPKYLQFQGLRVWALKKTRPDVSKHLLAKYAQLTKMDVALNNLVVRFICIHVKII